MSLLRILQNYAVFELFILFTALQIYAESPEHDGKRLTSCTDPEFLNGHECSHVRLGAYHRTDRRYAGTSDFGGDCRGDVFGRVQQGTVEPLWMCPFHRLGAECSRLTVCTSQAGTV